MNIADAPAGRGGTWSRDGVIVFSPDITPEMVRGCQSQAAIRTAYQTLRGSFPWFLPDGQHFLFQNQPDVNVTEEPFRIGSIDGKQGEILGAGSNAIYAQGHLLYVRGGILMAQPFMISDMATTGEAFPVARQVQTLLRSGRAAAFTASETGLLAYRSTGPEFTQLKWFERTGRQAGYGRRARRTQAFPIPRSHPMAVVWQSFAIKTIRTSGWSILFAVAPHVLPSMPRWIIPLCGPRTACRFSSDRARALPSLSFPGGLQMEPVLCSVC